MFEDPSSSKMALYYSWVAPLVILTGLFASFLDSYNGSSAEVSLTAGIFEMVFFLEVVVRGIVCPNRAIFIFDTYNLIDVASVLPLIPRLYYVIEMRSTNDFMMVVYSISPVLISLKWLRRFVEFRLLLDAFKAAASALPVLIYILILIAFWFSTMVFIVEPRDNIGNLWDALWLVFVTITTVGYGDVYPTSYTGQAVIIVLMYISCLYLAIPIGIVGNIFCCGWDNREGTLVVEELRNHVKRAGYTPIDLYNMFMQLDINVNNELDVDDFVVDLIGVMMEIEITDELARQVFESFADTCRGTMDFRDLLRGIYPTTNKLAMSKRLQNQLEKKKVVQPAQSRWMSIFSSSSNCSAGLQPVKYGSDSFIRGQSDQVLPSLPVVAKETS